NPKTGKNQPGEEEPPQLNAAGRAKPLSPGCPGLEWSSAAPCLCPIPFPLLFPPLQAMDSPYANGAYSPPYPPAASAAPHYTGLPQTRGYYCSRAPHTPYPAESTGIYQPPSPTSPWSYAPTDGPAEGSSLRRQQVPGYSPPQSPGMPIPQYPYGDNPRVTPQGPPPQPRPPEDSWGAPVYGVQPRYTWPSAPAHGRPFVSESHPPWTSSGAAPRPPTWDSKDSAYDNPEQSLNQHHYYSDVQHQHAGAMNDHKPAPATPRVQYSAQPQMYDTAPRKPLASGREAGFKPSDQPSANSAAIQPEIQRILHVMGEAEQLEQEVDEFVGKKTDKAYRLLEEMLTKLLLELDSIETGGQDSVRQARKESVHRIQAILEKLERKGL
ncbi:BAG4 regulator, partial [Nycticryphes semicollaris]|nr:BAG4 regulator [Nycticryphes semicollaris]